MASSRRETSTQNAKMEEEQSSSIKREAIPAAVAAEGEASSTSTQRAIQAILKINHPEQVSPETLSSPMTLQARPLPKIVSGGQLDPQRNPRMCCFDTASFPPAWSAATLCVRCRSLNQLLHASRTNLANAVARSLLGTSLITTDCVSEEQSGGGQTPVLPVEIIYVIVDHAVEDMRRSMNGSTVAALLHTLSWIRKTAAQAFTPIDLYECPAPPKKHSAGPDKHSLNVPRKLVAHIWEAILAFFEDFSVKKRKATVPASEKSLEVIRTSNGLFGESIVFQVELEIDSFVMRGKRIQEENKSSEATGGVDDLRPRTVKDACEGLDIALSNCLPAPRFANLHQRCLAGSLGYPLSGTTIELVLEIRELYGRWSEVCRRKWLFDTHPYSY